MGRRRGEHPGHTIAGPGDHEDVRLTSARLIIIIIMIIKIIITILIIIIIRRRMIIMIIMNFKTKKTKRNITIVVTIMQ